jgi:DNA-directed RNA polymerase specialized sigma24 family protein
MQIKKLDKLIENKTVEIRQLKAIASNICWDPAGERVQTSTDPHRISEAIAKYVDLENEIKRDIDRYVETKRRVTEVIESLDVAVEYDVVHKLYVQGMSLYELADMYDRSYSWVTTVHCRALARVQAILDREESR